MAGIQYDRPSDGDLITNACWGGTNPTPGTAINDAIKTAFADTAATALLYNDSSATQGTSNRLVLPRYLRVVVRTAPASATSLECAITVDNGNRYTSGGGTGVNPMTAAGSRSKYLNASPTGFGQFYFGGLTTTAATANRKLISRFTMKTVIPVVGDEFLINFSDTDDARSPLLTGTTAQAFATNTDGIVIDPGDSVLWHFWYPGNVTTAAAYEFEVGWVVKTG